MILRYVLVVVLASVVLISCQSDTQDNHLNLVEINQYKSAPSKETANEMYQAALRYIQENPDLSKENQQNLFTEVYNACKAEGLNTQAAGFLNSIIKLESDPDKIASHSLELIDIMQGLNNRPAVLSLKYAFLKAFPDHEKAQDVQAGIPRNVTIDRHIEQLGNQMFNDTAHVFNQNMATQFIDACEAHALLLPKSDQSLEYLHKAGETARSIKTYNKAISIYDWIYSQYPDDPRASQALFLKAFTYDNDLKNLDVARSLYEEYLEKYPNEDFADDTQFLLSNLGKSDEEILQELNKNN